MPRETERSHDVESLIRPEARAGLSFWRLLRLYLDPLALLKSVAPGGEALQYNCRHRRMLLAYARRWTLIAVASLACAMPLCTLARAAPILLVPIVGLDLVFSAALFLLFVSATIYLVLWYEEARGVATSPRRR